MAKKGSRFDTRTVLIILLVLAIIGAGYVIVTNLPEEIDYTTVDDVVNNKQNYVNKNVTIKGIYNFDFNIPGIVSTNTPVEGVEPFELKLNLSFLDINETDDLRVGIIYFFTGKIIDEGIPSTPDLDLILVVEKFEEA
jgi:hypothetical protein